MWNDIQNNLVFQQFFSSENWEHIIRALIYFVVGFILIRLIALIVRKISAKRVSPQSSMVFNKIISYTGMTVLVFIILSELGVNLAALLGAAGVLGLALGVASQKSIGNIVSGFFLLSEKPFEVGDVVRIGDKTGTLLDVDLLALKIKTFDNQLVRIPNEVIISTEVTNITRFPLRRQDYCFYLSYGDDLDRLEVILKEIARDNPLVLDEPEPFFLLKEFGDKGVRVVFGVWFLKEDYIQVKNSVFKQILGGLKEADLTIPFPQITLHEVSNGD